MEVLSHQRRTMHFVVALFNLKGKMSLKCKVQTCDCLSRSESVNLTFALGLSFCSGVRLIWHVFYYSFLKVT